MDYLVIFTLAMAGEYTEFSWESRDYLVLKLQLLKLPQPQIL